MKAPYVRPRMRGNTRVFDLRPTPELKKAFPDISRETYTTPQEANARGYEWKRKFEAWKAGNHEDIYVDNRSVEALVNHYKSSMAYGNIKAAATKRSYEGHLRHVLPVCVSNTQFAKMNVSDVDYEYAQKLWLHIQSDVSTHKANHTFKVLKLVWNEGLRSGKVKSNPFALVKLPKLPDRQVLWPEEHIWGMVQHCDDMGYHSMGTMLVMCYEFCQRPVDVRTMRWGNIDGKTGVSHFTQKKTGKQMSIKVTNSVKQRLHLHQHRNSDDYIFAYENTGRPYSQDRCNKFFRAAADSYGLPEVPLVGQLNDDGSQRYTKLWMADLRRTGATHASRAGCTDRQLMALTGHKNPQMLVIYALEGETESTMANQKRGLI